MSTMGASDKVVVPATRAAQAVCPRSYENAGNVKPGSPGSLEASPTAATAATAVESTSIKATTPKGGTAIPATPAAAAKLIELHPNVQHASEMCSSDLATRALLAFAVAWCLLDGSAASSEYNRWLQSNSSAANWTTDYATPPRADSPRYDRCKTTHRCNRAFGTYTVDAGQYDFRTTRFAGGRQENADLFLNFEDWRAGTVGLGVDYVRPGRTLLPAAASCGC